MVELVGKLLLKELTCLSSKNVNSCLRNCSVSTLEELTRDGLLQEVGKEAPVMPSLLKECVHVKRHVYNMPSEDAAIGMCLLFCYTLELYG